ncbi:hypothetical protein ACUN24_20690 [Pedobacter sp. WC2501]|uniref:hypothetical protein n=1 Tax=Pedobacter sp. WC2501 TaxID=3461400 RepID=UPI0040457915
MKYIKIEPEVIVGMGEDTNIEQSSVPPLVTDLHINLEDWLGDDLMEIYPVFIVTERLKSVLELTTFSGYSIRNLKLTFGDYFENNYRLETKVPPFYWMVVSGIKENDDFYIDGSQTLNVSFEALSFLKKFTLKNALFENDPVAKEVDRIFELYEKRVKKR